MHRLSSVILLAALSACTSDPAPGVADPSLELSALDAIQYDVAILDSLGGTQSRGMGISNGGAVAGWSLTTTGQRRAVLWRDGELTPLGTLGGPNSTVPWPGINDHGMVVGISQTGELDSLNEGWSCEIGSFIPATNPRQVCRGFFWYRDQMQALPTLGGTHGFATGINNRGQAVGWAETALHDSTCTGIQKLQFKAVLWEPLRGTMAALEPWPGHSSSAATAINNRGQAVGISGDCDQAVGRFSARRAVLWDRGGIVEIPNLGGTSWHTPMDINEHGDVVGFSNPPGPQDSVGEFVARAFYWRRGSTTVTPVGVLTGDAFSQGMAVNDSGVVVGVSFGGTSGSRAFIWRNGVLQNLNDLVSIGNDVLQSAQHINDAGQITGRLRDAETGQILAFVATPRM